MHTNLFISTENWELKRENKTQDTTNFRKKFDPWRGNRRAGCKENQWDECRKHSIVGRNSPGWRVYVWTLTSKQYAIKLRGHCKKEVTKQPQGLKYQQRAPRLVMHQSEIEKGLNKILKQDGTGEWPFPGQVTYAVRSQPVRWYYNKTCDNAEGEMMKMGLKIFLEGRFEHWKWWIIPAGVSVGWPIAGGWCLGWYQVGYWNTLDTGGQKIEASGVAGGAILKGVTLCWWIIKGEIFRYQLTRWDSGFKGSGEDNWINGRSEVVCRSWRKEKKLWQGYPFGQV